ncbi:DUF3742 family protein [Acidovorax sp. SUPP3434]|uniref:DUF3742 family protein n=1 Tax=Acidovorax sp. SUPP3434 TaxID=2920880 RepID=UPI0023DE43C0|nr:DUF3742 family protein [Acidovorax sp. SUPP3434]GKT02080.1 DUF3742 family protein [Acidovorax sp. SUPP3434]
MTTQSHTFGWTYRLGRGVSHAWRSYARKEHGAAIWLVEHGIPAGGTRAVVWMLRLLTVGGIAYLSFWLALLLGCLVAVAWSAGSSDDEQKAPELRDGIFGFGLYHRDGSRIDPYDPDDDG